MLLIKVNISGGRGDDHSYMYHKDQFYEYLSVVTNITIPESLAVEQKRQIE
jgi:hypothetical protein